MIDPIVLLRLAIIFYVILLFLLPWSIKVKEDFVVKGEPFNADEVFAINIKIIIDKR